MARSLAFNILFFGMTALATIVALPAFVLPRPVILEVSRLWSATALWLLRVVCRLDYEVRGAEHLPDGPALVASKHQSAWDTIVMPALLGEPVYVLKRELTWIPLFGWYLIKAGQIAVDREAGGGALRKVVKAARRRLAEGRQIMVYPEGTRSPPGTTGRYNPGIAALYADLGVPVVPVALNSGLYWARRAFRKRPGTVLIEFLPAIPPGLPPRAFLRELEARIEPGTRRLEAEGRG